MGSDSPSPAWYEPPDEPEPPDVADWLRHNNAPVCRDCGGKVEFTGNVDWNLAEFRCLEPQGETPDADRSCRATWVDVSPVQEDER